MKKIILSLSLIIFSHTAWGLNFSIAPTKFEADLSKPTYYEAYLINNTGQPLRIEIYTEAPPSYEKYNLNENITIFPKMISIKPASKQTVRFRVRPSENIKNGEYRSLLVFREVPGKIKKTVSHKFENEDMKTELTMITEVAVNILGETGKTETKGKIKSFGYYYKNKNLYVTADVLSEGNTSLKIDYEIREGRKKISEGKLGNSLRRGKSEIIKEIPLDISGLNPEKLKIILKDQNEKILHEENLNI